MVGENRFLNFGGTSNHVRRGVHLENLECYGQTLKMFGILVSGYEALLKGEDFGYTHETPNFVVFCLKRLNNLESLFCFKQTSLIFIG